jgi:hypothetical protein
MEPRRNPGDAPGESTVRAGGDDDEIGVMPLALLRLWRIIRTAQGTRRSVGDFLTAASVVFSRGQASASDRVNKVAAPDVAG